MHQVHWSASLVIDCGSGDSHLLQVHVLGQLLLQHVLQLLVHLSQVLVSRLHQISEDRAQTPPLALGASVTSVSPVSPNGAARHV